MYHHETSANKKHAEPLKYPTNIAKQMESLIRRNRITTYRNNDKPIIKVVILGDKLYTQLYSKGQTQITPQTPLTITATLLHITTPYHVCVVFVNTKAIIWIRTACKAGRRNKYFYHYWVNIMLIITGVMFRTRTVLFRWL